MPRSSWQTMVALGLWLGMGWGWSIAAAPSSENLLPDTTKGYLCITDFGVLKEQWNKTQVGRLMNDPAMKPFADDLQRQFEERLSDLHDRLGVSLDDLRGVPAGQVAVAMVQPAPDQAAVVLLMDVTGRTDKAKAMLDKMGANFLRRKGVKKSETGDGVATTLYEVPRKEDDREKQQVGHFLEANLLAIADHFIVLREIRARLKGKPGKKLADAKGYQTVVARLKKDAGAQTPHIRWYIEPVGYLEAVRTATPEESRRKGKAITQILRNQGFDALKGVGGYVSFKADKYEILHRTAVYAPPPHQKAMKMLVFPNSADFAPQRWVPREIATYVTTYCDLLNGFDNFGSLFDELFGEGQTGVWQDVLESLKKDPSGPQIDLRGELMAQLGKRISVLGDYQLPISIDSERLLVAIEVKDETAVMAAMEKWMKNDASAKRRDFKGKIIWEMVEEPEVKTPDLSISIGDIPAVGPPPVAAEHRRTPAREERLLPHAAVTVAHGCLLIASHIGFMLKILPGVEERKSLARDVDFQRVQKELLALGVKENCTRTFSRSDEEFRTTYELIRQGKMPQSETCSPDCSTRSSARARRAWCASRSSTARNCRSIRWCGVTWARPASCRAPKKRGGFSRVSCCRRKA